jgi:beta-glucanase (GH16 family)
MMPSPRTLQRLIASLFIASIAASCAARPPVVPPFDPHHQLSGYTLVWHDEFDSNQIDANVWAYRTDSKLWSSQQPENISVENGHLRIGLHKEDAAGKHYTGGGIITKRTFRYGYYEARLKCPAARGWHTSFWTMLEDGTGGTAPGLAAQEIDICDQDSVNPRRYSAGVIDWRSGPKNRHHGHEKHSVPDLSAAFHTFGCEFTPTKVRFFFDGELRSTIDATKFPHNDQNIWLTCIAALLGSTEGVDDTALPAYAEFDWVRFFQLPAAGASK